MIENESPAISDSLWTATANATPDAPPLTGAADTDVAIIGAGYTGLSAALHLAERGIQATVLEAETPGWGASGRNGGQVNPGFYAAPDEVEAVFGAERAARMVQMAGAAPDLVFDLIRRHAISCDAIRPGWIRAAHSASGLRDLRAISESWQRRDVAVEMLDADETAERIGARGYVGAFLDPRGGNLHPLNYALGLADAAQRAGATLHGQSAVTRLERAGAGHAVHTGRGVLRARRVLICTNGYTGHVTPKLRRSVVPVRSVQVATAPLSDNVRASILPGLQAVADTRRLLLYFRMDAQGRFIMGGRGSYDDAGSRDRLQALRDVSGQMFAQLGEVEWQHAWGGFVAITTDHMPHLNPVDEGVIAGLGYNGRGVAMATAMGKVMADWASGVPEDALDFPMTPLNPIPFHRFRKLGVRAVSLKYRMLDRLGV